MMRRKTLQEQIIYQGKSSDPFPHALELKLSSKELAPLSFESCAKNNYLISIITNMHLHLLVIRTKLIHAV